MLFVAIFLAQGHGFRKDLFGMLKDLKPAFIRFPGILQYISNIFLEDHATLPTDGLGQLLVFYTCYIYKLFHAISSWRGRRVSVESKNSWVNWKQKSIIKRMACSLAQRSLRKPQEASDYLKIERSWNTTVLCITGNYARRSSSPVLSQWW